jgi:hypothetical protein
LGTLVEVNDQHTVIDRRARSPGLFDSSRHAAGDREPAPARAARKRASKGKEAAEGKESKPAKEGRLRQRR